MTDEATPLVRRASQAEEIPGSDDLKVGQWYWVTTQDRDGNDNEPWLGCVVHRGSNFISVKQAYESRGYGGTWRIHLDEFWNDCKFEPDAPAIIQREISACQARVQALMAAVQEITKRLALHTDTEADGGHTEALATVSIDLGDHKTALVKAKDDDLPALFEQIRDANKAMAGWMVAPTIPLQAEADALKTVLKTIESRIFHVELYAGLTEEAILVTDGAPAAATEKLHLMQRRHYMDEECLANYQAGGMEFKHIGAFNEWLAQPENRDRILPFPRCMVAFRVRRHHKERSFDGSLSSYIRITMGEEGDKKTYLYIRNGEQTYCLATAIEFEEKLFPDMDRSRLEGKLWVHYSSMDDVIDQKMHDGLGEDYAAAVIEYERRDKEWEEAKTTVEPDEEYLREIKRWPKRKDSAMTFLLQRNGFYHSSTPRDERNSYKPFDQTNLDYDKAMEKFGEKLAKHNRISLLLQGLFDRSELLHPHPKVELWKAEGFEAAVELVFDVDRALDPGEKPDFEAYRARLNESLKTGSVTVGQERVWLAHEREKAEERCERYFTSPHGNPGPGHLAYVSRFQPRVRRCGYRWERERIGWRRRWNTPDGPITATFTVEASDVLNVDAYTPGDYKQFFADHRTRAEYLEWAPSLLAAEDYHAGKAKVGNE